MISSQQTARADRTFAERYHVETNRFNRSTHHVRISQQNIGVRLSSRALQKMIKCARRTCEPQISRLDSDPHFAASLTLIRIVCAPEAAQILSRQIKQRFCTAELNGGKPNRARAKPRLFVIIVWLADQIICANFDIGKINFKRARRTHSERLPPSFIGCRRNLFERHNCHLPAHVRVERAGDKRARPKTRTRSKRFRAVKFKFIR